MFPQQIILNLINICLILILLTKIMLKREIVFERVYKL